MFCGRHRSEYNLGMVGWARKGSEDGLWTVENTNRTCNLCVVARILIR